MSRVTVPLAVLTLLALACLGAQGAPVTVTSNPLWTYAGVLTNNVSISGAVGTWTWADWSGSWFGPEGDPIDDSYLYDEWITNNRHGQLIGYVASGDEDPNTYPRVVPQDDLRLFEIGTGTVPLTGLGGSKLWLGFNDDWDGDAVWDNQGSVQVTVEGLVPEPATLVLLGLGGAGLLPFWRRRRH